MPAAEAQVTVATIAHMGHDDQTTTSTVLESHPGSCNRIMIQVVVVLRAVDPTSTHVHDSGGCLVIVRPGMGSRVLAIPKTNRH